MKTSAFCAACFVALSLAAATAFGQGASPRRGTVIVPGTNVQRPSEIGARFHTNYLIFVPTQKFTSNTPQGETPGSLACIYDLVSKPVAGCPISTATAVPSGGSGIIAVVDAYDYPTAESDFDTFSEEFGLPHGSTACSGGPCFTKVSATGSKPRANAGWALEAALDIEWSHAMAPDAQIVLVEAVSSRTSDLLDAVSVASKIVSTCNGACKAGQGKGEVSMSWGGSEFSQEDSLNYYFTTPGVVYTASSGDSGGVPNWPSTSPDVVSAGGTTINRAGNGNFIDETAWADSGGGDSAFEPVPGYQSSVATVENLVGDYRGTPDFSFDANPASGVSVYDSTRYEGVTGWMVIGGTSVSTQALAGIINLAGGSSASTNAELTTIYNSYNSKSYDSDFTDIVSGSTSGCHGHGNSHHQSSDCYSAATGWDFVTGVGSDLGTSGK